MGWKIPLFKMYSDNEDIENVTNVIKRGMFWGLSSETMDLEKMIAKKTGRKYCVFFNSGTSALHAIMIALGFSKLDEVIVPSFTFIATTNSVMFVDAKPKFADIEEKYFGLDPDDVLRRITKKTKAVIPVHYAGNPCRIQELVKIAKDNKILLIEDAAAALGSSSNNKMAGSFGDCSIISFAWNKIITSGEGGAAVTNSKEIFEKLILIRSHGRIDKENYFMSSKTPEYVTLGYNWRVSAMTAALGISQMSKLEKLIHMRNKSVNFLNKELSRIEEIQTPIISKNNISNHMMYTIRIKNGKKIRDLLHEHMKKKQIQTKIIFEPIHLTRFYQEKFSLKKGFLKNTEKISEQVLTLPMFSSITKSELNYIIDSIDEFFRRN